MDSVELRVKVLAAILRPHTCSDERQSHHSITVNNGRVVRRINEIDQLLYDAVRFSRFMKRIKTERPSRAKVPRHVMKRVPYTSVNHCILNTALLLLITATIETHRLFYTCTESFQRAPIRRASLRRWRPFASTFIRVRFNTFLTSPTVLIPAVLFVRKRLRGIITAVIWTRLRCL